MSIFHSHHIKKHVQHARLRFSIRKKRKKNMYVLLILVAVVFIRRGIWWLLDMYVLPNHPAWSMIISVVVGLFILYLDDRKIEEITG